jgi:3-oxoadipate enol-lactonase
VPKLAVDDIEISYHLDDFTDPWTENDVVLMHHGYCRNSRFWNAWVPALARSYKTLRFDVRGCGESSVPPEGCVWSAQQLARDALGVIDGLGIQRVTWIGESSGGIIGIVFAASYPDRVNSLVLCDTPFKLGGSKLASDYSMGQEDTPAAIEKLGFKEWCTRTMGHRIDKTKAPPELEQWYLSEMAKTPQHVAKALIRVFDEADISPLLAKIEAPTLVLSGARSPIAGPDQQRLMKEHLPSAHFQIFEDIGHGSFLLVPDRCTAAVLEFLGQSLDACLP